MVLSPEEVKKVARLASLPLSAREVSKFSEQLSAVLTYINKLNELDTTGVKPLSQTTFLANIFRKDKVEEKRYVKGGRGKYFKTKAVL